MSSEIAWYRLEGVCEEKEREKESMNLAFCFIGVEGGGLGFQNASLFIDDFKI